MGICLREYLLQLSLLLRGCDDESKVVWKYTEARRALINDMRPGDSTGCRASSSEADSLWLDMLPSDRLAAEVHLSFDKGNPAYVSVAEDLRLRLRCKNVSSLDVKVGDSASGSVFIICCSFRIL